MVWLLPHAPPFRNRLLILQRHPPPLVALVDCLLACLGTGTGTGTVAEDGTAVVALLKAEGEVVRMHAKMTAGLQKHGKRLVKDRCGIWKFGFSIMAGDSGVWLGGKGGPFQGESSVGGGFYPNSSAGVVQPP